MKVITLITRRPDLTRAAFRDYYETRHAPLGSRYFPFEKYVRNHIVEASPADPGFDCLMECWLDRQKALASLDGSIGDIFAEDEGKFMVKRGVGVDVEERLIAGDARGVDPRGIRKEALMLSGDAGLDRNEFLSRARKWAEEIAYVAENACERLILDEVLPGQDEMGFPAEAVLTAWRADGGDVLRDAVPPSGIQIRATLLLDSQETTPAELTAAFGKTS